MSKIVISHRRDDVPAEARRIRDALAARVASAEVVMADAASVPDGEPVPGDTLIVVIGPRWLEQTRTLAAGGEPDAVRDVIATALARGLPLIPVRIGEPGAMPSHPRAQELPEDIRALAQIRSRAVSPDRLDLETLALAYAISPKAVADPSERLAGNSTLKMWLWASGIIACTVLLMHLLAYLSGPTGRPGIANPFALPAWTIEGRIRRAIEAALAKGRHPDEARRCQVALINASDSGTILFDTASADLDQRSHHTLDALARIIKDCPDFVIEVEGHTDNAGEPGNNQRLSERRANAVRDYLIRAGVPPSALIAVGHGALRPIVPNVGPANMARNRRIEFNITAR